MTRFSNLSIRRRLMLVTMSATALALIVACAILAVHDRVTFKNEMVKQLSVQAEIVADNCTAAVSFENEEDAHSTLIALRADPQITDARVLSKDGLPFACYHRQGPSPKCGAAPDHHRSCAETARFPLPATVQGHAFASQHLDLWRPIMLDGKVVGALQLRTNLSQLQQRSARSALVGAAALLLAGIVAFAMVAALKGMIVAPVQHLAEAARQVSQGRDYSVRAPRVAGGELGELTDCFNGMLTQIQERDAELRLHRENLEEQVAARTRELQETNTHLSSAKQRAEQASHAKSNFLANMSHEIRTPMTAIMGYADLLLRPEQGPTDRMQCIKTIRRNGEHLLTVINDILDISKIEAGRMTVERIRCSPFQVIAEAASLMRVRATEKNLDFKVEYVGAVPETIETDPTRLRQVLMNLLSNAVKFTERGHVTLIVRMTGAPNSPRLWIEVSDSGIGISPQQQARLFAAFSQADESMTRRFGGTGLGLAISARLVELLGGEISVRSTPGIGSVFTVELPVGVLSGVRMVERAGETWSDPRIDISSRASIQAAPARQTLEARVLIAEDGLDNQTLIAFYLESAGAKVEVAENGLVALNKYEAARSEGRPFDLILMDMQMPELDGYQAASRLRAAGATLPIIALTAHAMTEDRAKCINAGCSEYLTKPIDPAKLLQVIGIELQKGARPRAVRRLRSRFADNPKMSPILAKFVARLPDNVEKVRSLLDSQELEALRRIVHDLKGAGGGYGFPEITEVAAQAEAAIKNGGTLESIQRDVNELINLIQSVEGYTHAREVSTNK